MQGAAFRCAIIAWVCIACSTVMAAQAEPAKAPDPALQTYLSANGMLNRGLYELATEEYRKFLSSNEGHEKAPVAHYGLAVCLFRMAKFDDAAGELAPLSKRSGFEFAAEVGTMLGQCHVASKRFDDAAAAFEQVIREHGDHALADEAAAGQTEALYLGGKHGDAADAAARFAERWPDSPLRPRVEFFGGLATMASQKFGDAARRFEALLARSPKGEFAEQSSLLLAQCYQRDNAAENAIRQYRAALEKLGDRYLPDGLLGLATLLQQNGDAKEAGKLLDRLLEKFPDHALAPSAKLLRGRTWFDQGAFERALPMFEAVSTGDKLADEAAYWVAKCKLRAGDSEDAAGRLADAIKKFPDSPLLPEMHYDRAIALVRAKELDATAEALATFRSRFPDHALAAEALQLLAVTEHQRQRYAESGALCRTFLETHPDHATAAAMAFLAAENEFLAGDYEKSVTSSRSFLATYANDPQAPKATLRLGTALYRLQNYDEAQEALAKVAGLAAKDEVYRPALLTLGDIHFQRGEWKQAEERLSAYLTAGMDAPAADDALLKLGLSLARQDRNQDALKSYDRLMERFPNSPHRLQAMFERGQAFVALKKTDDAVTAFEAVLSADEHSRFAPYALNHLATIATQRKEFEKAAKLYERVAGAAPAKDMNADALFQSGQTLMAAQQFKQAEEAFTKFNQQFPGHARAAEARARRAIALARQDRHADAVEAIGQIETGDRTSLDPALLATLRYEKAWCLRGLGRDDEAAKAYSELLAEGLTGGVNVHAMLELSGLQINAKRFDDASKLLARLREAMADGSSNVPSDVRQQAVYRSGVCAFELERFADALAFLDSFAGDFPDSTLLASASFYAGESAFKLGRFEDSVKHLTRVAERFKDDAVYGPSLLRLGEALAALQRFAPSERVFNDYLERFADSDHAYQARFGVGWAREHQKRFDPAIEAYREVVAKHQGPTAARAQFQIGECLFAQNKYDEAARELVKVDILYAYPEWSAAALYEAGRCFEKLGKSVEARNQFKAVAEHHGGTRWAELASQRLTELSSAAVPGH